MASREDQRVTAEHAEEWLQQELTAQDEEDRHKGYHEQTMCHCTVCPLLILPAQAAGDVGVDSHTDAHRTGHNQGLHWEGQRDRCQGVSSPILATNMLSTML